jgi:hypothetical protein
MVENENQSAKQDPLVEKNPTKVTKRAPTKELLESLPEGEVTSKGDFRGAKVTETAKGKELRIRKLSSGMAFWEIYYYPGGEVPAYLKGSWTSEEVAKKRIARYLEMKQK